MALAPKHHYTEDELELLTEEERAGLEDPNFVDDPIDGTTASEKADADDAAAAAENNEDDEATKAADAAAAAAEEAARKEPPAKPDAPATAPAPTVPTYTAPADLADQIKALEGQVDALDAKFDEGELTAAELRQQTRDIERQIRELERTGERAQLSWDAQTATWENETVKGFLADHPAYTPDSPLYPMLDREVRKLQTGEYKDNMFSPDILTKAHESVLAGVARLTGAPVPNPKDTSLGGKQREIPPNLGGLPSAADDDLGGGGDFAYLDRLQGVAYEDAFAKLTADQQEAYLAR